MTAFPVVLAFVGGKLSSMRFECLGGEETMEREMGRWVFRLDNSLKEWGGENDHQHQLIVHC